MPYRFRNIAVPFGCALSACLSRRKVDLVLIYLVLKETHFALATKTSTAIEFASAAISPRKYLLTVLRKSAAGT